MNAFYWWFWSTIAAACVVWYSTITIYVAIRGAADIKEMLGHLGNASQSDEKDSHA